MAINLDVSTYFPLNGIIGELIIIFLALTTLLSLELALILCIRFYKNRKKPTENKSDFVYGLLMLFWGIMSFFSLLSDMLNVSISVRFNLIFIGYIFLSLGMIFLSIFIEKWVKNRVGYLSYIIGIFILLLILFFIIKPEWVGVTSYLIWIPFIIQFRINRKTLQKRMILRRNLFISYWLGAIIILLGYIFTTDLLLYITQFLGIYLIGNILQMMGLIIFGNFFLSVPTSSEVNWKDKFKKIFLFYGKGVLVFKYDLEHDKEIEDMESDNQIMGLYGLKEYFEYELPEYKSIKSLNQEMGHITLFYGKYITGIAILKTESNYANSICDRFLERIEIIYQDLLPKWKGDLQQLASIKEIFFDIFYPDRRNGNITLGGN